MAVALLNGKKIVLDSQFFVTVRQTYSYAAMIITIVCEQNRKREITKNYHVSVQHKIIYFRFQAFTEGHSDIDGVHHD